MSFVDHSRFGPPRRVPGGLKARSTRGAIGQSWWSRRFLDVLESFALGTRLTRGRSYARAGQVLSLDVEPGTVTASVQGSRPVPYQVKIGLTRFPEPVWARVEALLAAEALYSARLLAGDLPPDLERVFVEAGVPLFPGSVDDLRMRCDCPDFAVPCKHLAATFYLLAEAFDADPFEILHWRGRSRAQVLAHLRRLRAGRDGAAPGTGAGTRTRRSGARGRGAGTRQPAAGEPAPARAGSREPGDMPATAGPDPADRVVAGAALALADLPDPAPADSLARFWLPPVPLPARPPTLTTEPDLLLRQLGPPGAAIGGPGTVERLRVAYERFGAAEPE